MFRKYVVVAAALVAGLSAALSAGIAAAQGYPVQPGDTLAIEVLEDDTLSRQVLVLPDGTISFPMAGSLPARGRTTEQIRQTLASRLAPNFAAPPNVHVSVSAVHEGEDEKDTQNIYVMGETLRPGLIEVEPGTTLLQALATSGGFGRFAAVKRIELHRTDRRSGAAQVYAFDYSRPAGGNGVISGSTVLAPGDVIVIPQRRLFE